MTDPAPPPADAPPPSAADYGRSLRGLGVNLIVRDVGRAVHFACHVLGASLRFRTDAFAALQLGGHDFMVHVPSSYRGNELYGTLASDAPRGVGIELRCYGVDPDGAETRARMLGYTVLAGTIDKPHGLRECMLVDDDGFVWIPSCHTKPES